MSWLDDERQQQNIDDYQSYKITLALKGRMSPTLQSAIRLIKARGKYDEKIQSKKRKPITRGAHGTVSSCADSNTQFR